MGCKGDARVAPTGGPELPAVAETITQSPKDAGARCRGTVAIARVIEVRKGGNHVRSLIARNGSLPLIGASLTNIGLAWWIGEPGSPGYPGLNFVAGLITVLAIMILMIFGSGIVQRGAILWGIIIGAAAYSIFGTLDFTPVAQSSIVGLPSIFPFGFDVQPAFVLLMMVA